MKKYKVVHFSGTSAPHAEVIEAMDMYDLFQKLTNHWDVVKIEMIMDAQVETT